MDRRFRFGLSFLVLAAPFLLAACGGSSGGGGGGQQPPTADIVTKFAALDNTQETTGSTSPGVGGGVFGVDTVTGECWSEVPPFPSCPWSPSRRS